MPFAAPLRRKIERDTGALAFEAPAPYGTTTQFPKPAVVVKDARQRFLSAPPVHLELGELGSELVRANGRELALPLTTILASTRFLPVPDASTCTFWIDLELSAPPLKSVIEGEIFPLAST